MECQDEVATVASKRRETESLTGLESATIDLTGLVG